MAILGRDPTKYGEHSGRRGGATAASEAGVSWLDLKRHGRWISDSAPQRYIETAEKKANAAPALLAATRRVVETGATHRNAPQITERTVPRKRVVKRTVGMNKLAASYKAAMQPWFEEEQRAADKTADSLGTASVKRTADRAAGCPKEPKILRRSYGGTVKAEPNNNAFKPPQPIFVPAGAVLRQQKTIPIKMERRPAEGEDGFQYSPGTIKKIFDKDFTF